MGQRDRSIVKTARNDRQKMTGDLLGVGHDPRRGTAYVSS